MSMDFNGLKIESSLILMFQPMLYLMFQLLKIFGLMVDSLKQ